MGIDGMNPGRLGEPGDFRRGWMRLFQFELAQMVAGEADAGRIQRPEANLRALGRPARGWLGMSCAGRLVLS
ncbi:MAG: hypothetical protein WCF17_05435 [Terracidiphilus sp.]